MLRDVLEVVLTLGRRLRVSIGEPAVFRLTDETTIIVLSALIAPESAVPGSETAANLADVAAVEAHFEVRLLARVGKLIREH